MTNETIIEAMQRHAAEQATRDAAILVVLQKILAEMEKGKK